MAGGLTYVNQVGAVEGMNQAAPGTLIPESFLRWSQDVLFDRAGLIRRRGPFASLLASIHAPDTAGDNERVVGVFSTLNPVNERVVGVLINNNTMTKVLYYKVSGSSYAAQTYGSDLGYLFEANSSVDAKAALGGGSWIGIVEKYGVTDNNSGNRQALYYWRGGCGLEGTKTTHASTSVNTASTTISIPSTTGLTSGMFVYADTNKYIGVIKTVDASSITLEKLPFKQTAFTGTGITLTFKNIRPYMHRHGRGLITKTDASGSGAHDIISGDIGTSGEGHFAAASLKGYNLYRASDNAWIGLVSSIYGGDSTKANKVLALDTTAHSTFTMSADEYIAIYHAAEASALAVNRTAFSTGNTPSSNSGGTNTAFTGVFNATYAGLQWFGCMGVAGETNRIVFSASHDPEAVDLSKDSGDTIVIPGVQQMRGIASSNSGLVVLMEDKTYLLRGNTRSNFSLELLFPEGCICNSSIVETGGGVIWASRAGILYYDGATVRNLTANNLGVYYSDGVTGFDPNADICTGFIYRDYVFFHFTKWSSKYSMTRYEPVYAGQWATSAVNDASNSLVDAATSAAPGLAGVSWRDFSDDDISWEDISSAVNTPIGHDYEDEQLTSITMAVYLPTNAVTTISNLPFRGATFDDGTLGLKALVGVTRAAVGEDGTRVDLYNIDTMLDTLTDGEDVALSVGSPRKGPDLFMQTKHYSVGDPVLKKWFQRTMLNVLLQRGAIRVDFVDAEDNDAFDVYNLKHKNWEIFKEKGLTWSLVEDTILPKLNSPNASTWINLEHPDYPNAIFKGVVAAVANLPSVGNTINDAYIVSADNALYVWFGGTPSWQKNEINYSWLTLLFADYERQTKRFSLRQSSIGFRLYQLNNYRELYQTTATRPQNIQVDAWNIGFKPLRGGRV